MNETQKALLEKGVVVLPDVIEHDTYLYVLEALIERPERVVMYCAGNGGSARDALAIVDLVQQHGHVVGMLMGFALSANSVIWASCIKRYVSPNGGIGVHRIASRQSDSLIDIAKVNLIAEEYTYIEARMIEIYAAASRLHERTWHGILQEAGSDWYRWFGAAKLVGEMGMAQDISEYFIAYGLTPYNFAKPANDEGSENGKGQEKLLNDVKISRLKLFGYWLDWPDLVTLGDQSSRQHIRVMRRSQLTDNSGEIEQVGQANTEDDAWVCAWNHAIENQFITDNKASQG